MIAGQVERSSPTWPPHVIFVARINTWPWGKLQLDRCSRWPRFTLTNFANTMNKATATPLPDAPISVPSVSGPRAKNLMLSVLEVVSTGDVIEAIQEKIEKNAQSDYAVALARLRGEQAKPAIEAASGPSISTAVAAKRLKRSAEHIRNQIERDNLVGYPALGDRTRFLLPLWQFAAENLVHPWVPELIKAYGSNSWALLHFVTVPRTNLDGDYYLHLLQTGRVDEVLAAARRSNLD